MPRERRPHHHVNWAGRRVSIERADDDRIRSPLSPPSISTGGDPCGLAVFPVSAQPAHGRGDAGGARYRRQPRNGAALGREIRQGFANGSARRSAEAGDKWHLDEVVITIAGKKHWLWRAVDHGSFLTCSFKAARHQSRKTPDAQALEEIAGPACDDHRQAALLRRSEAGDHARRRASTHKGLNNRAENSHQPTRRRERIMKRFKSARHVQSFSPSTIRSPTCFIVAGINSLQVKGVMHEPKR